MFLARLAATGMLGLAFSAPALAHPHIFVTARAAIVFDAASRLAAIRQVWQFDEAFSAYAIQGLDADRDGVFTRTELAPLARLNVESLAGYDYLTWLEIDGLAVTFTPPTDYWLELYDGRLTLFLTLSLTTPAAATRAVLNVFDPEYYIAVEFAADEPVRLAGAPASCSVEFSPPGALDPQMAAALALIPPEQRVLPENFALAAAEWANTFTLSCPAAAPVAGSLFRPQVVPAN